VLPAAQPRRAAAAAAAAAALLLLLERGAAGNAALPAGSLLAKLPRTRRARPLALALARAGLLALAGRQELWQGLKAPLLPQVLPRLLLLLLLRLLLLPRTAAVIAEVAAQTPCWRSAERAVGGLRGCAGLALLSRLVGKE
jgi:hypothetical protein